MINKIRSLAVIALIGPLTAIADIPRPNCAGQLTATRAMHEIAKPIPHDQLFKELQAKAQVLLDTTPDNPDKGYLVFLAPGEQIPQTLLELGRLREIAFRSVGEGSGLARDNDAFDSYYHQLVPWDKKRQTITGGYRLGMVDEIVAKHGFEGLYTFSLFDFTQLLQAELRTGTIEVGRSFVLPEYKKGLTLSVMLAGIARFLQLNPSYHHLIGPVSISGDFLDSSKDLITNYLMSKVSHPRAHTVVPRVPPNFINSLTREEMESVLTPLQSLRDLEQAVKVTEQNPQVTLPPLIKIYLDLHVRFLSFNWDESFNALDGLIWTDIATLPHDVLSKYMGAEAAKEYLSEEAQAKRQP